MPAYRKASIRELASAAYELGSSVAEGDLAHDKSEGKWVVGNTDLNALLAKYAGQEVLIVIAPMEEDKPMPKRVCRTCGTEYVGVECPRCREARIRLRGR